MATSKITRQYQNALIVSQTHDSEYDIAESAIGVSTDANGLIVVVQGDNTIFVNRATVPDFIKALQMTCSALTAKELVMDIVDGLRLVAGAPTQSIGCLNCHSRMHEAADEIERLRAELDRTRKAAFRGMDAAKAASSAQLKVAKRLLAESNPDALESERGANASLTDEIDRLRAELAVAGADLAVSVGHLSRLAEAYGCDDFTSAIDAALAAKGEE